MAESPAPTKRARTSLQQEGNYQCTKSTNPVEVLSFRHLKNVRFPSEILALPHVLKPIDTLLLTPKEAMVEAAGTGEIDWLNELLNANSCFALDAVEAAAANGHLEAVQVLYHVGRSNNEELSPEAFGALRKAVLAAAKKGFVDIVNYLLLVLVPDADPWVCKYATLPLVSEVFTESAANGHLEVLELMMGLERIKRHMKDYGGGALPLAIAGQHAHVVDFLLANPDVDWNWMDAFEEAVAQGQTATAERICNGYPLFKHRKAGSLFVALAVNDRKNAVEYLFNNGRNDLDLVHDAFVEATATGSTDVARFLHGTGLVSMGAFGRAWKCAPSSERDSDILFYLYGLKRASSLMINQWFERMSNLDVLKRLLENEAIPDSSIVAAFSRAAHFWTHGDVEFVEFLYRNKAITSGVIDQTFVNAVGQRRTDVMKLLQNDSRLTPEGIDSGFVKAVAIGHKVLVRVLHEQHQVSPGGLLKAFERVVNANDVVLVQMIVRYLSADNVPHEYKLKAFMCAAQRRQIRALEIIVKAESGDWPIDELKAALGVAWHPDVEQFIRKIICDQLIRGRT